jgi:lauroyl/myristoyl acyltransferase
MFTTKPGECGTKELSSILLSTDQNADVLQYTNEQFTENIKNKPFSFMWISDKWRQKFSFNAISRTS